MAVAAAAGKGEVTEAIVINEKAASRWFQLMVSRFRTVGPFSAAGLLVAGRCIRSQKGLALARVSTTRQQAPFNSQAAAALLQGYFKLTP
jgi:hypothetical protein